MKDGWLKPYIGKTYTFEQAQEAHNEIINSKGAQGKLVFVP